LAHDLSPHPPRRAELADLLKYIVVAVEEEREAWSELIDRQPRVDRRLHVRDPIGQRERHFLDRRASLLAEVVSRDRDRVPPRDPLLAVREQVDRQPDRSLGGIDEVPAGDVLLEDVVLGRARELLRRDSLLLG